MSTLLQDKETRLVKEYSDKMISDVGVQPDLSEEDAKQYLKEVMEESDEHCTSK